MLQQLHIPKTGGLALAQALGETSSHRWGHTSHLWDMPDPVITIIRDPVARWVSAFDMCSRQFGQFPETHGVQPDEFVTDDWAGWLEEHFQHVWHPLSWWLRSPEYVIERGVTVLHTETLDADWAELRLPGELPALGAYGRNDHMQHGTPKTVLSTEAARILRKRYADDYRFLEVL